MVGIEELWPIGNPTWIVRAHRLPHDRAECVRRIGTEVADHKALAGLRTVHALADIDPLEKARNGILRAFERPRRR